MRARALGVICFLVISCNTMSDLRRWYAPIGSGHKTQEKDVEQVIVLETEPTGRDFVVIGVFMPPLEAFTSSAAD